MTNTLSALSFSPYTHTHTHTFHGGCVWSESGGDTLSDGPAVVSHSFSAWEVCDRLYFLCLSRDPSFVWWGGRSQRAGQGHVIYAHNRPPCPLWANTSLVGDVIRFVVKGTEVVWSWRRCHRPELRSGASWLLGHDTLWDR